MGETANAPYSATDRASAGSSLAAARLRCRDHQVIGRRFLWTGLGFLVVGGLLALAMRWRLAWPDARVPILGEVDAAEYNALFTAHGTIMVFFVVVPLLIGAIGTFVVPLQIGAANTAWPRLARLSFWLYPTAGAVLLSGFAVEGGGAAAGWTSRPALSALAGPGQVCWTVSLLLVTVSIGIAALNSLATIVRCRAPGMTLARLPLTVWAVLISAALAGVATPLLITALGALLFDHLAGTTLLAGQTVPWRALFRFWAYPLATLIAIGMTSDVIAVFARKPIFGYRTLVGAMVVLGGLGLIVGALQAFAGDAGAATSPVASAANLLVALPLAIVVCQWLGTLWGGSIRFATPMLFALGAISMLVIGGSSGLLLATPALNSQLRGTYFVVVHFHYVLAGGSLFGIFAGVYFWYPKMFGRRMDETLGAMHFLLTFVSFHCTFFVMHAVGTAGMPRRYPAFDLEPGGAARWAELQPFQVVMTISALGLVLAQGLFFFNFLWSRAKGKPAGQNPWQANTLEWSLSSPPPPAGSAAPRQVHRGPYEYSSPLVADDYLPQWLESGDFGQNHQTRARSRSGEAV